MIFFSANSTNPTSDSDSKSVPVPPPTSDSDSKSVPVPPSHASASNADLISMLSLPKVEITPFDGDPLQYHAFMNSFKINVDRPGCDPHSKLTRLIAYTQGAAREAIQGFQIAGGDEGYEKALSRLRELFGSKHTVTQATVNSLLHGKALRTPEQIRKLSYQLTNAHVVLGKLDALDEVNAQVIVGGIVKRLPQFAVQKWERRQLKAKREKGEYLKFPSLVDFVNELADDLNDPLCGQSMKQCSCATVEPTLATGTIDPAYRKPKKLPNASGNSSRFERFECILCGEGHLVFRCARFRDMAAAERVNFAREKNLCFNCLKGGHQSAECPSEYRCLVCKEKHSALLHLDSAVSNASRTLRDKESSDLPVSSSPSVSSFFYARRQGTCK